LQRLALQYHASASNGLSDIETHIKNALCNRPLTPYYNDLIDI
jgi:hypothetical protein